MRLFNQIVNSRKSIAARLFSVVSDEDIYQHFLGHSIQLGKAILSPLRDDDENPSFSFFVPTKIELRRPNQIWWTDFAVDSGNVTKFVQLFAKAHYGIELQTYEEIIRFIATRMKLDIFKDDWYKDYAHVVDKMVKKVKPLNREIKFKSREFTIYDLRWWILFGIDESLLKEHNVRSLKYLLDENSVVHYTVKETEIAFVYVVYDKVKVYFPLEEKENKWLNTCPSHYLLGAEQLKQRDYLIITKSLKDVMTFKSFIDADVISPQSEGGKAAIPRLLELAKKYKKVFVVVDYDEAGKSFVSLLTANNSNIIVKWVSTKVVNINGKLKPLDKDISDYTRNHGIKAGYDKVKELFGNDIPDDVFRADRVPYLLKLKEKLYEEI